LDQLGTSEYVDWIMHEPNGRGRQLCLFVTYYTGAERPFVPVGVSYSSRVRAIHQNDESITITSRGKHVSVPLKVNAFEKEGGEDWARRVVIYAFHANGEFPADRSGVRQIIAHPTERYSYFSRVEVSMDIDSQTTIEQAVDSLKRFLQVVIPALLEDHWPDWETRPISPPSWFPWLPATPRPAATTRPSQWER
jgi:hypothetical protein